MKKTRPTITAKSGNDGDRVPSQGRRRKTLDELYGDMTRAAKYYYERKKLHTDRCPKCRKVLTLPDRVKEACPFCNYEWPSQDLVRLTQDEVAELIKRPGYTPSRSDVQRLLNKAEEIQLVQIIVTKPEPNVILEDRAHELESRFKVKARVVQGRERLFRSDLPDEEERRRVRNSVLRPAARVAAGEIVEILSGAVAQRRDPTLCLSWGYTVNLVVQELRPRKEMPSVTVVPFVGALTDKPFADIFDGNYLVQRAAEMLLCEDNAFWLLAPALVETDAERAVIEGGKLVKNVIDRARLADVVVVSVAVPDPVRSTLVRNGLMTATEIAKMKEDGAIGEIGGHFFDERGEAVPGKHPIGLTLEDLKQTVHEGRTVLAVVAGHADRIDALLAAIKSRMINALVTDHVTAKALLERSK